MEGFEGVVQEIDEANGTVQVAVSLFGRETPATLEFSAVKKLIRIYCFVILGKVV